MKIYTETELLNRAASLCSRSEHCIADITDKLRRRGSAPDVTARIIRRLVDENFIDEERFAKAFVRDKYRFDKWGSLKIRQALLLKHIPEDNIDTALDEINREEYLDNLKALLTAKRKNIKDEDDYQIRGKLIRFALGRGYEMDEVLRFIDHL